MIIIKERLFFEDEDLDKKRNRFKVGIILDRGLRGELNIFDRPYCISKSNK